MELNQTVDCYMLVIDQTFVETTYKRLYSLESDYNFLSGRDFWLRDFLLHDIEDWIYRWIGLYV